MAAKKDVAGAGGDGFGGGGYAGLICVTGASGPDAGGDDGEVVAQFGAHGGGFVGGGDDALASTVEGEGGEAQDFFAHRSLESDLFHFVLVEAGEDGDAEHEQSWVDDAGRVHGGVQHFAAASGVDGQH